MFASIITTGWLYSFLACTGSESEVSSNKNTTEATESSTSATTEAGESNPETTSSTKLIGSSNITDGQLASLNLNWYGESFWKPGQNGSVATEWIEWESNPKLEGSFYVSNSGSLKFNLANKLPPEEEFQISVSKLYRDATKEQWIIPQNKDDWKISITTPKFATSYISLKQADYAKNTASFSVKMSHDVDSSLIQPKLNIEIGNQIVSNYKLKKIGTGHYQIDIANVGRLFNKDVKISLGALSYPNSSKKTEPYTFSSTFTNLKPITLHGPFLKETAGGFTVEYICDDSAVSRRSWYWNSDYRFDRKISRRCSIDTAAIETSLKETTNIDNLAVFPRERGFAIIGNFQKGNLNLTIPSGISTQDGGLVLEPYIQTVDVPLRKSSLRFFSQGRYLPTQGWANLYYQSRNVKEMEVSVREVRKENLHNWLGNSSEQVRSSEGDLIYKEKLTLKTEVDQNTTQKIDLSSKIVNRKPGLYEVILKDINSNTNTSLRVQVTDMNIVAKKNVDKDGNISLWAWVLHSRTNKQLSSVKLSVLSPSGSISTSCYTDSQGFCKLDVEKDELKNPAYALYAERKGDDGQEELSYLTFHQLAVDLGLYDTSGSQGSSAKYRVAAHSDRGAYRPGDTVQLFALIRSDEDKAPKSGLPVELKIRDGRYQVVDTKTLNTNGAGVVTETLNIPDYANTGSWTAEWKIKGGEKNKEALGSQSYSFRVEDLMPERMAVTAKFDKSEGSGGVALSGTIDARYLFGSPASEAAFTVRCDVESKAFQPSTNKNYRFGSESAFENFYLGTIEGNLDEDGKAAFTCPNPERLVNLPGMAKIVASVDVMEAGSGRSTHRNANMKIHPSPYYIGLQIGADEIKAGVKYPVAGIVVDWKGNRYTDISSIDIQSSQADYSYQWYYDEETHRYRRETSRFEIPIQPLTAIPVKNGLFSYSLVGEPRVAEYRIRAQKGTTVTLLDIRGEYYSWYYYSNAEIKTPDPFRPDYLEINAPSKMNLTETATVKTVAPYPGKILWTVERDGIIRNEWVEVKDAGEVSWSFNLAGQPFQNNVYISALLVKDAHAEAEAAYMPSRAFGAKSIAVQVEKFTHNLKISVPKEVKANTTMKVSLDLGANLEKDTVAMVAVVDEGLLSLTNFQSPNPTSSLFPRMPLEVQSFETIGWNISSPSLSDSVQAGGGAGGEGRRKAKVVKPVALWSGVVNVPSSGKVDIPFNIPQYSGQVRVMVVTSSPTRFASGAEKVIVKEPLTLQATLPRFLTKGDQFQIPVFITNLTGKEQEVEISLAAIDGESQGRKKEQPIRFLGKERSKFKMKVDEQKIVAFQAEALRETGFATFIVTAKAGAFESKETAEVPFSSTKPTEREFTKIQLAKLTNGDLNGSVNLDSYLTGWTTEDTTVWATNNPYAESLVRVRDLIRYPYGCIEQTSSSLRPLLTAADILPQVDPTAIEDKPIKDMVQSGIKRLAAMQTSDGGLGYWPGAGNSHPWGTAYATHVLLDARDAGHEVMPELLSRSLSYLERVAGGNYDYGYYSYYMPSSKPYAHYLLAREGKGKPVAIRNELNKKNYYNYESEYMLKTALYLAGDRTYEKELRTLKSLDKLDTRYDYWSFRSHMRSKGLVLALHQEMFGSSDSDGEGLASELNNYLSGQKNRYLSTQVLGWTTYALSKRVLNQTDWKSPSLTINNKKVATSSNSKGGASWNLWDSERKGDKVSVKGQNSDTYLMISTIGIKNQGNYEYGDNSVSVTRTYLNADGSSFNPKTHKLSDEIVVSITVENLSSSPIHELALVDRIPAGWEINNPNLGRSSDLSQYYSTGAWNTEYISMRDKQLEIFGDLNGKQKAQFIYTARATTSGQFFIPPISLESMYNDHIWSRKTGQVLFISGPWADHLL